MALSAEIAELAAEPTEVIPDVELVVGLLPDAEPVPFPDAWLEEVMLVVLVLPVLLVLEVAEFRILGTVVFDALGVTVTPTVLWREVRDVVFEWVAELWRDVELGWKVGDVLFV